MLDLGWTELLLIGIVALIVVGPKDLPGMFQAVGRFVGKARGMAREFSRAMNDAADQSGVSDVQKTFKTASNPMKTAMNELKKTTDDVSRDIETSTRKPLDPDRQAAADKIRETSAEMASARRATEGGPGSETGEKAAPTAREAAPVTAPEAEPETEREPAAAPADTDAGSKA